MLPPKILARNALVPWSPAVLLLKNATGIISGLASFIPLSAVSNSSIVQSLYSFSNGSKSNK